MAVVLAQVALSLGRHEARLQAVMALCWHRYISEVYGGLALHPVDLMDAGSGRQLAALTGAGVLRAKLLMSAALR